MNLLRLCFLALLFTLWSCGSDEPDTVSGKYIMTELDFGDCNNITEEVPVFEDGALCVVEDGINNCVSFCLDFTETTLDITIIASADGAEIFNSSQSVSFDPESEEIDFCLPDADCDGVTISNDRNSITIEGFDADLGCSFSMLLERS